ncbi:tetratricopeptide repeat protein [Varunaivibrio sulfuroxidans]|uniref:Tetratricopeptide repeat protein n=1 Tax=Varunaivibrio sulfuroxidans TaxID=1773489 RepID=A0A4R3JEX9_9PROT|nr:tetratricopeptide repeat protein [Varunaivibrio sulfuroxidans]TCS64357.1 tetratricopeptide repeat protein [Varunaivibrio sulfuroxidans]WES31207.1 tetratricopeptide repeat protein [Varunaivibrio sulfuroxidans]
MSYILDALRKSEAQRNKETPPSAENFTLGETNTLGFRRIGAWFKPAVAIAVFFTLLALVAIIAKVSIRAPSPSPRAAASQSPPPVAQQKGPRASVPQPIEETVASPRASTTRPSHTSLARTDMLARTPVRPPPHPIPTPFRPTSPPHPTQKNTSAAAPSSVSGSPTPAATKPAARHSEAGPTKSAQDILKQGWKNINEGLFNQAYDDFSQAVALEPGFAKAWFARGWAEEKRGHREGAIADYSRVLKLTPGDAQSFLSRGVLRFYNDDFDRAALDFKSAARFARPELERYALLWLYVADRRGDVKRDADLQDYLRTIDLTPWPGVILKHFDAKASREDVERGIAQSDDVKGQRRRACVAYYFLGQKALIDGDPIQAKTDFNRAVQTGVTDYRQYEAAQFALRRLSVAPGNTRP